MQAFHLNDNLLQHPYASRSIAVNPNPPQVGQPSTLALALLNPEPTELLITRVQFKIALFGMGVKWEELPPLTDITLSARNSEQQIISTTWTPTSDGHRCVRATVEIRDQPAPLTFRRNLQVIE